MKYLPSVNAPSLANTLRGSGNGTLRVLAIRGGHMVLRPAFRALEPWVPNDCAGHTRRAFSLIEILISLVFVSIAFLPIYNLFRFGQKGTMSNVKEIEATNCASDLVNFVRELDFNDVDRVMLAKGKDEWTFPTDKEISAPDAFPAWTQVAEKDFTRSLYLKRFKGNKAVSGGSNPLNALVGGIDNLIHKRRAVPNFLAEVKITFKKSLGPGQDDVKLYTIVLD